MRAIDLINKLKAYSNSEDWKNAEVQAFTDYKDQYLVLKKKSEDRLFIHLGEIK